MEHPRVSVVLATYNGSRYLEQQLRSLVGQSHRPDELLVNDDASSDGTVDLVRAYLRDGPITCDIQVNRERVGAVRNFEILTRRATGDVVFFADQDDIWKRDKIATVLGCFADHPSAGAVFSDARVVDASSQPIAPSLWSILDFSARHRREWDAGSRTSVLVRRSVAAGASLAFRSRFKDLVLPFPDHGVHDFWVVFVVAQVADVIAIPEKLLDYRVHGGNEIGIGRSNAVWSAETASAEREGELLQFLAVRRRLDELGLLTPAVRPLLDAKIDHLRFRTGLPPSALRRGIAVGARLLRGEYGRYALGARSAVGDVLRGPRGSASPAGR